MYRGVDDLTSRGGSLCAGSKPLRKRRYLKTPTFFLLFDSPENQIKVSSLFIKLPTISNILKIIVYKFYTIN